MTLMRLSARADYALRAAIELAAASSGHVTADQLARAQQIPGKFLETILTQLRRAGLIRSQRGPDGGFWLARPAAEISLAEIIRAIDGQLLGVRGERPENITYPGMVLGPPAGEQFGEAAEGVEAAVKMRGVPGRGAGWIMIDVRDLAALHLALLEKGRGPRRYMAGGRRITVSELASLMGAAAERSLLVFPIPDVALRSAGRVFDVVGPLLPFETPINSAAMQYYTQMPASDDGPAERDFGLVWRDPAETIADTVEGLRRVGRL